MTNPPLIFEVNVDARESTVEVDPGLQPMVAATPEHKEISFGAVPVKGDKGDPGPPGPPGPEGSGTFEGTAWFSGQGAPVTVVGSKPGDYYIDTLTGDVYKLGD